MRVGRADGEAWLRLSEAADLLGVSLNTLRRWSDSGRLACYRSPGGHRRYRRTDIDALLRRQSGDGGQTTGDGCRSPAARPTHTGETADTAHSPLATLAQVAAEGVGVSSCVVATVDGAGRLRVVACYGVAGSHERVRVGDVLTRERAPVADEVQHTHRRVVIADIGATNLLTPTEIDGCRTRGDAAVLALPLAIEARLFGVMELIEHRTPRAFTGADVAFAEFVARHAAGLIAAEVGGDVAAHRQTPLSGPEGMAATAVALARAAAGDGRESAERTAELDRLIDEAGRPANEPDVHACLRAFLRLVDDVSPGAACTVYALSGDTATPLIGPTTPQPTSFALVDEPDAAAAAADGRPRIGSHDGKAVLILPLRVASTTSGLCEIAGPSEDDLLVVGDALAPATELLGAVLTALGTAAALRRRVRDLETVVQAGVEDAARLSTDEVLHAVIQRLSELTECPVADVYAVEGGALRALVSYDGGRFDPEWEGVVIPISRYPCSLRAVESGEIAIAASLEAAILGPEGRFSLERWGYQSQLSMPLLAGGRVIGLVELSDYVPRDFADELELVRGLGRVAAQALENARLFELVERRSRILNELVELGTFASTCRDFNTVLRHVAERLLHTLDAANCDIYQAFDDGLRCVVSYDRSGFDDQAVGRSLDVSTYPTLVATLTTGQLLVVSGPDDPQLTEREREVYRAYGFNSEVCVPLIVNDELFGLIDIYDTRARQYSEYLSFLRSLGMNLAAAFATTRLFDQLEHRTTVLREIVEIGTVAAQSTGLAETLAAIADRLRLTIGAADCDVYALGDGALTCLASVDEGGSDDDVLGEVIPVSRYPAIEMAIRTREPMVVASLDDPRVTQDERGDYARWGFKSLLSLPLVSGEEVVGVVDVFDTRERDYGECLDFLRSVGLIIAGAMRNAGLVAELTDRNRELAELVGLGHLATGAVGTTALLRALTERVSEVVHAAGCQVFALDGADFRCLFVWEDGKESTAGIGHALDLERFPTTRRALEQERTLVVASPDQAELSEVERRHYRESEWRSDVVVPLAVDERVVGLLEAYDRRPRDYAEHLDFLRQAGQIVAGVLENAQLVERLERANAQLGHLVEAGLEFGATLDPDAVLRSVAGRLCVTAAAICCDIYRIDGDQLRCLASLEGDVPDEAFVGTTYDLDRFDGVREVVTAGRPMVVRDMEEDPRISDFERAENLRHGHRAKIELPLVSRGGVVGLASLFYDRPHDAADLDVLQSLAQVAANALANAALYDRLAQSTERVTLVGDVSFELSSSLDLGEVLENTAHRLCALADMPCCDLYTLDAERRLDCVVSLVDRETDRTWQGQSFSLDRWSALRTAVDRRMPIVISSTDDPLLNDEERALMDESAETAEIIFPLISKDVVIGVLELLETRGPRSFHDEEIATISAVCRVAALAIHNAKLYEDIKRMHLGNLKALSSALNAKDYYTLGHAARVAAYMVLLGEELGWDPELLRGVEEAAYLHDIGKIGVSDRVLLKPSVLNPREWDLMRQHPVFSADIIRPLFDEELATGVRHHHERYDGSGYPDGLAKEEIPLVARAMCVVDSYDAMSFRRPYRQALSYAECREELARCAGTQFDPGMVAAFGRVIDRLHEQKKVAVEVARAAAVRLDCDAHASLRRREDEDSEAYRRVVQPLRTVRDEHPPTRYLTTFVRRGSTTMLVVDAEEDEALRSHIGDETFSDEEILRVFADQPVDRTVLFVDQFGVWISGAAPARDEHGDIVAVTNADLPATTGATEVDGLRSDVTRTFATMVADAAARLGHAELEAITDGLTGLYNHRYLHERLDEEIERCVYQSATLALLLVDLDDFRAFNDRYGHSAGDRALRGVARVVEASLRQVDLAARFGGEEFGVILIDADGPGALEVAERIRTGIAQTEFTLGHEELSVSIGMALCPADASHKEELLDKADWAMYLAKRRGRNQVVSFGAEHAALTPEQALSVHDDHVSALAGVVDARDTLVKRRRAAVTHLALAVARELGLEPDEMRGVAVAAASACTEGGTMTMKGESLPERLASTAAAYESLVTRTPYRPQLSESEALQELRSGAGCDLDKRLWAAFEEVLARPRA